MQTDGRTDTTVIGVRFRRKQAGIIGLRAVLLKRPNATRSNILRVRADELFKRVYFENKWRSQEASGGPVRTVVLLSKEKRG